MSKIFQYLRTSTFRKNVLIAIATFAALFCLVFFGLRIYTNHDEAIAVPLLKGKHISEAIASLEQAGLSYQIDSVYQMDAKPGLVIEQDPEQNFHVKSGRTIYLTIITQTAPEVNFPEVTEKTYVEAAAILKNHGLRIGDTIYVSDIARDLVLEARFAGQQIRNGRPIPKGSRIDLYLGNGQGANEVEIPDLTGLSLVEAKFALIGAGLQLGNIIYMGTDTASAVVIAQSPGIESGLISIGSTIDLSLENK